MGKRGAPLPHLVPAFGSCPSVFNPLGGVGRTTKGAAPLGPGHAASQPPTHHCVPHSPEMRDRAECQEAPGREEGATNQRGTLPMDHPSFLEVAHNFEFPLLEMLVSRCLEGGGRAPSPDSRVLLPSAPASTFFSLLAL